MSTLQSRCSTATVHVESLCLRVAGSKTIEKAVKTQNSLTNQRSCQYLSALSAPYYSHQFCRNPSRLEHLINLLLIVAGC